MAKQTFTALQVLTAAQMTALQANDYNQTVSTKTASYTLIAADAGTKIVMNAGAANTTITVNTSLFSAGDTLTILNTSTSGTCTITAGTATVATAGSLALGLNQGGTLYFTSAGVSVFQADGVAASSSGLVCVKAETSVSAVTSATADNIFTSTYTNYLIQCQASTSTTQSILIKFRAGGVSTSTNYNRQRLSGAGITADAAQSVNQTSYQIFSTGGSTIFSYAPIQINSPQSATKTLILSPIINNYVNYTTGLSVENYYGNQNSDTQFDGIEFLTATGTFTMTYAIYGYSKTV